MLNSDNVYSYCVINLKAEVFCFQHSYNTVIASQRVNFWTDYLPLLLIYKYATNIYSHQNAHEQCKE